MIPRKTYNFEVKILNNKTKLQNNQKIQLNFADLVAAETKHNVMLIAHTVLLRPSRNCRGLFSFISQVLSIHKIR